MIPNSYWIQANSFSSSVYVEYRHKADKPNIDKGWAVTCGSNTVYDKFKKKWVYEPSPSNRDDVFLNATRFSLLEAEKLAHEAAHKDIRI